MSSITGSAPTEAPKKMENTDVVLVTGATGGVGRRVVDVLRKQGLPVRVLVSHLLSILRYTLWHLISGRVLLPCSISFLSSLRAPSLKY